jgi:very-short-patch-repair endonuclease
MREMNEIERKFYDAFCDYYGIKDFDDEDGVLAIAENGGLSFADLQEQFPIGLSIVDFYFDLCLEFSRLAFAVEIDGHDYHKTKEQRYHDYMRERKLQAQGIIVIRFSASEVYVNAEACVEELDSIMKKFYKDASDLDAEHLHLVLESKKYKT